MASELGLYMLINVMLCSTVRLNPQDLLTKIKIYQKRENPLCPFSMNAIISTVIV